MSKRLGIMQPYFLPYIGYWQLINACDEFVIYDDIQYTKKGWINRNRFLSGTEDALFTLPLKKDSDFKNVNERYLSADFDRNKLLRQLKEPYRKAPDFPDSFPLIENIIRFPENNLFSYILFSIRSIMEYLEIRTPLVISSTLDIPAHLKGEDKVMSICKNRGATAYLNPIGGIDLYDKNRFKENGIDLQFHRTGKIVYRQGQENFIPFLSILDLLMFNPKQQIQDFLSVWTCE